MEKTKRFHLDVPESLWHSFKSFLPVGVSPTEKIIYLIESWVIEQQKAREAKFDKELMRRLHEIKD
jgi:hypothetical protein